ncbi:calcium-translocating P-type ATPase, SERCA-type [Candidatus Woesearchaeota archaeon]|nr:calcium-translocating P-type ATPase, SERCA-type [Candidatus Woesearchaeota archaeon]
MVRLFYNMPSDEVIKHFASSEDNGLTSKEVEFRLKKFGRNKLAAKKKVTILHRFINQFKELMIIILILAGVIAFILGESIDAGIIFFVVLVNAVIGVLQEYKAEKAIEALKKMMTPHATILRNGIEKVINAEELVPGDILILEEGTRAPADARIIEAAMLKVDEAVLTGESVPRGKHEAVIEKENIALGDRNNMLFMGTNITSGRCKAVVTATGMSTEFGKIAGLTAEIKEEKSPLQKELVRVGKFIAKVTLGIVIIVFFLGLLSGQGLFVMFLFAVSLGVAAVPEGLPATMTIALALGVRRMAKRKAIMRKLSSVETLGSTTVICTDKTGTLTKNEMTVKQIWVNNKNIYIQGEGYEPAGGFLYNNKDYSDDVLRKMLRCGLLCNNAVLQKDSDNKDKWVIVGDPTEGALVVSAKKTGLEQKKEEETYDRVFEIPFSSDAKRMITINKDEARKSKDRKGLTAYMKGATGVILDKCSYIEVDGKVKKLSEKQKEDIKVVSRQMSEQALRVLGFAYKTLKGKEQEENNYKKIKEQDFVFLGLQGMIDPPRQEVKDAVAKCRKAGIKIYVVTGDHGLTARAIAKEIGIATDNTRIIKGPELEKMNDQALSIAMREEVIFARVSPEHKMRIASLLMSHGEVVAMTGDGVNDAPALKKADIGVAMGITGTDVSKEASEMVLTDDSFATIVNAVEEGRSIYSNITKFIRYMFSTNLGEIIAILLGMLLIPVFLKEKGIVLIVTAVQILWINLGTDVLPALALGVEPPEQGVMNKPPRNPRERIISSKRFAHWLMTGLIIGIGTLAMFLMNSDEPLKARTMAFSVLVFYQLANVFNCRHETKSLFHIKLFSNKYIIWAVLVSLVLQIAVIQVPLLQKVFKTMALSLFEWGAVVLLSLTIIIYDEIRKVFARKHMR